VRTVWRLLLVIAGAGAALVLLLVLRDGDEPATQTAPSPTVSTIPRPPPPPPEPIVVRISAAAGTVTRATIPLGRQVVLVVNGPAGEEVHLHGYDVKRDIPAGGAVRLPFRATIPGRFEVELEASHRQIADLTVR
jgi:hypothetical protein